MKQVKDGQIMEGVRPTILIEVSFYVVLHDLKQGGGDIPKLAKIIEYKE